MNILLGNLSVDEMEAHTGVKFPPELILFLTPRHQENASNIQPGKWHCFDMPFNLVCGDRATATEIYHHLQPLAARFKKQLTISIVP